MHHLKVFTILVLRGEYFAACCHGTLKQCQWWRWWWLHLCYTVTTGRHLLLLLPNVHLLLCCITNSNVFGQARLLHKWLLTEAARERFHFQVTGYMGRKARFVTSSKSALFTVVLEDHRFLFHLDWFGLVTATTAIGVSLIKVTAHVFIIGWMLEHLSVWFLLMFVPCFFVCALFATHPAYEGFFQMNGSVVLLHEWLLGVHMPAGWPWAWVTSSQKTASLMLLQFWSVWKAAFKAFAAKQSIIVFWFGTLHFSGWVLNSLRTENIRVVPFLPCCFYRCCLQWQAAMCCFMFLRFGDILTRVTLRVTIMTICGCSLVEAATTSTTNGLCVFVVSITSAVVSSRWPQTIFFSTRCLCLK